MRNSTLAAAAIAAGLAVAAPATNAAAMPVATPGQLGLAEGAAGALEKTVLVCGPWACYWRPDYWGYYLSVFSARRATNKPAIPLRHSRFMANLLLREPR